MKKSDLKVGYVVKLRKGAFCMVLPTTKGMCFSSPYEWFEFSHISDNLEHCGSRFCDRNPEYDVVEVYGHAQFNDDASKFGSNFRELLWKREEKPPVKKMTVKEICDALGYDVEIVKDGADE